MSAVIDQPLVDLRPMTSQDLPGVIAVEEAAYPFPWTEAIFRDCLRVAYYCCVLEGKDGIIGHGIMSVAVGECHLLNICIHPDYQRQGHGQRMMNHLLSLARHAHAGVAYLEVRLSNTAAQEMYRQRGFREIGLRKDYYPAEEGREDALILMLDLQQSTQTG